MSRPAPRRPSRTTTPRPRKLAGRSRSGTGPEQPVPAGVDEPVGPAAASGSDGPTGSTGATTDEYDGRPPGPLVAGVLVVAVAVVALLLVGQVVWFVVDALRDDRTVAVDASGNELPGQGTIAVPPDRPVIMDQLAVQDGLEAAASAATSMFARNWDSYDQEVDAATELMTGSFAEEYRRTTDDVKQEFVAKRTKVQVQVVAQGVVRANDAELEALIFLNQYILRGKGKDESTVITPYRALLTMVHTDRGWFVDDVQTR